MPQNKSSINIGNIQVSNVCLMLSTTDHHIKDNKTNDDVSVRPIIMELKSKIELLLNELDKHV